jgi:integrase/recombinase XerD
MRTFPVQMPSGMRYWTVIGEDLLVMSVADAYLRYLRFGRDAAESTTKTYAGAVTLYLSRRAATGQDWQAAAGKMPAFVLWLRHSPSQPGTTTGCTSPREP